MVTISITITATQYQPVMTEQSLQALSLINDCYKYIMDLTTNDVVITEAIKFVQTNKEKLTMSAKEDDNGNESKEPDYDNDKDQLEEEQEEETGELKRNNKSSFLIMKDISLAKKAGYASQM